MTTTATQHLLPLGTKLGEVHLRVTDTERALRFWSGVLGLRVLDRNAEAIRLGSGDHVLVVLHPGATAPVVPRRTGLYHVALFVPTRKDLARAIARLFALRYPNSPTDHTVSETTYLSDPDGNGVELTLETPWRGTFEILPDGQPGVRTSKGEFRSGRDPVDLDSLFAELDDEDLNAPVAFAGVHHVHLHVADLSSAQRFYRDLIGFRPQMHVPAFQMADFGLRPDEAVHALALNTWSGVNASPAPAGTAGLHHFTVLVPDEAAVEVVAARLAREAWPFREVENGIRITDPSSNVVHVVTALVVS